MIGYLNIGPRGPLETAEAALTRLRQKNLFGLSGSLMMAASVSKKSYLFVEESREEAMQDMLDFLSEE